MPLATLQKSGCRDGQPDPLHPASTLAPSPDPIPRATAPGPVAVPHRFGATSGGYPSPRRSRQRFLPAAGRQGARKLTNSKPTGILKNMTDAVRNGSLVWLLDDHSVGGRVVRQGVRIVDVKLTKVPRSNTGYAVNIDGIWCKIGDVVSVPAESVITR